MVGRFDNKPLQGLCRFNAKISVSPYLVIPAKAGIHLLRSKFQRQVMDSRLRGNDEPMVTR